MESWMILLVGSLSVVVGVECHHGGRGGHGWGGGGGGQSDSTWTAPAISCQNSTQTAEDFATCELLLSTASDALGIPYGGGAPPPDAIEANATMSARMRLYLEESIKVNLTQGQQPQEGTDALRNDVCCFLLTFEPMRNRCCRQLARFCEATAGRPGACKCAGGRSSNSGGGGWDRPGGRHHGGGGRSESGGDDDGGPPPARSW